MTRDPKTIAPDALIDDALTLFEENKITALFVVEEDERGRSRSGCSTSTTARRRDEHRHLDPGALCVDALSREAAGRTEGSGRSGQAADPAQRRGGAAGRAASRACSSSPTTSGSPRHARRHGVGVIMTSPECRNGTERCAEALASLHEPDLVINFQGDALLTPPGFVEALIARMEERSRRAGRDAGDAAA